MAIPRLVLTQEEKNLSIEGKFLIDTQGNIADWRDSKGNWVKRAIFERKYADFILSSLAQYWRPAFCQFNHFFYEDFLRRKMNPKNHERYYEKINISLKKSLAYFKEELLENHDPLYFAYRRLLKSSSVSWELLQSILKLLLDRIDFNIALVDQFYFELTGTKYGWENVYFILPYHTISANESEILYEEAQPSCLFGPDANPSLRGRIQSHVMPEEKSIYVKTMRERGFNVIAGPSGTMGRIQLLLKIFRHCGCLTDNQSRWITLAIASDFVQRGHHTFIETMQACQADPLNERRSCFGLFLFPKHLLVSNLWSCYQKFFKHFLSSYR
ncbi:MAG: hypothetical protein ACD_60C00156G0011 [uncultured bacterium]|nr:MAG: hypothetical protein ACD_60C00156G0011 [uncultured bacterium]